MPGGVIDQLRISYVVDVADKATKPLLASERAVQRSVVQTARALSQQDAALKRSATVTTAAAAKKASAHQREGKAAQFSAAGTTKLVTAQRTGVSAANGAAASALEVTAAYNKQAAAAQRAAGAERSRVAATRQAQTSQARTATAAARSTSSTSLGGATAAGAVGGAARGGRGGALVGVFALGAAVKQAATFEQQLSRLGSVAGATGAQLAALRVQALKAGADTAYSAKEAAVAQTELAKGGISTANILAGGLKSALALAAAGELELGEAAAITANSMNLFGLRGKDSIKVADQLATAANATTADVADFGMALSQGGSVAKAAGLSFSETVVALEALAKSGIKNSDAGTSLKTAIIQLLKPTDKQAKLAKQLGLSFLDASGDMKSLADISGMLRSKLGDQTNAQRTATLATLAGTDGVRTLTALYDTGPAGIDKFAAGLRRQGSAAAVAKQKQDNLIGSFEKFKGSVSTVAIAVGTPLIGPLRTATDAVAKFFTELDSGTGRGGKVAGFLSNLKDGLTGVEAAPSRLARRSEAAPGGVGERASGNAAQRVLDQQTRMERRARQRLAGSMSDTARDANARRLKQLADARRPEPENTSATTRAGLAIRGVIKTVMAEAKRLGPVLLAAGKQLVDAFKPAMPFLRNVLLPLIKGIGIGVIASLVGAFKVLVPVIKIVSTVLGAVGKAARPLRGVFQGIGTVVGFIVGGPILKLLGQLPKVGGVFRLLAVPIRAVTGVVGRVIDYFGKMPGTMGRLAGAAVKRVGDALGKLPGKVGGLIGTVAKAFGRLGKSIVSAIVDAIKSAPGAIVNAVKSLVPGPIRDVIGKAGGVVKSIFGGRRGGRVPRFQGGGLVPIVASGGEMLVDGGHASMIPGPSDRDGTPMFARPGSAILTGDGQARMAMGASLSEAIRSQAPHFAKGGVVPGKYTATSYGPPWGGIQGTGVTRTGVNLKGAPHLYGIATDPSMIALGSKVFAYPNPFGYSGRFSAFDTGGAIKGRRVDFYDWRGRKRQNAWGRRSTTISSSRIAPRGDGEDTYRAPGGGGAETNVQMLGRDRMRGGLLGDAFAQGRAAGQAGLTRGAIGREGNPITKAILEALAGAGTQPDKGGTAKKASVDSLSDTGGLPAGSKIAHMHAKAAAIDAKHYQYAWGGGHGRIGVPTVGTRTSRGGQRGLGYDCSGGVSAVLGSAGLLKSPLTSGSLMSWGRPGAGKRLAVHADAKHVIMRLGRKFWGTGEANPDGGAGWLPGNTMSGRGVVRTWPGMRRGGIVGRYRAGGTITGLKAGAVPAGLGGLPAPGRALSGGLARAMTFVGGSFDALAATIERATENRLQALRAQVKARIEKGGSKKVITRLQGVLDSIDGELGRRVGRIEDAVDERSRQLDRSAGATDRDMRVRGLSGDSSRGLGVLRAQQAAASRVLGQNVTSLQSALRRVTAQQDREAIRDLTAKVQDAKDALAESFVREVELWRDQIRALGSEAVGNAQHGLGSAQTGVAMVQAQQRLNGTTDTAAGMREQAGALAGVIPAIAATIDAATFNAQMLAGIGDIEGWRQAMQDAGTAAVDLANAQADAADLLRQAAMREAQDRVDTATHGRTMSDLALQKLSLEQQLVGTFDSAGGALGRADFIRQQILPAIQAELDALMKQQDAAKSAGDQALADQIAEAIAGKQNEILQAQVDATKEVADNTSTLKEFGGSTAFSFNDQGYVDFNAGRIGA